MRTRRHLTTKPVQSRNQTLGFCEGLVPRLYIIPATPLLQPFVTKIPSLQDVLQKYTMSCQLTLCKRIHNPCMPSSSIALYPLSSAVVLLSFAVPLSPLFTLSAIVYQLLGAVFCLVLSSLCLLRRRRKGRGRLPIQVPMPDVRNNWLFHAEEECYGM